MLVLGLLFIGVSSKLEILNRMNPPSILFGVKLNYTPICVNKFPSSKKEL
jgi:hypothetical protein